MSVDFSHPDDYFDSLMVNRSRLLWAIATRRQLERWESLLAAEVAARLGGGEAAPADLWASEIERHFALIAARHLLRALDLEPASAVEIDETVRAELKEGRDLLEHWAENMPIFLVKPRTRQPSRSSGRDFAKRNPRDDPYGDGWDSKEGPMLLPNVPARVVHELLDAVEAEVLADDHELARFIPPRAPSPWIRERGEWWPKVKKQE